MGASEPTGATRAGWTAAAPHPLWPGGILFLGAVLGLLDGHWGLAVIFLVFSTAMAIGHAVRRRGGMGHGRG